MNSNEIIASLKKFYTRLRDLGTNGLEQLGSCDDGLAGLLLGTSRELALLNSINNSLIRELRSFEADELNHGVSSYSDFLDRIKYDGFSEPLLYLTERLMKLAVEYGIIVRDRDYVGVLYFAHKCINLRHGSWRFYQKYRVGESVLEKVKTSLEGRIEPGELAQIIADTLTKFDLVDESEITSSFIYKEELDKLDVIARNRGFSTVGLVKARSLYEKSYWGKQHVKKRYFNCLLSSVSYGDFKVLREDFRISAEGVDRFEFSLKQHIFELKESGYGAPERVLESIVAGCVALRRNKFHVPLEPLARILVYLVSKETDFPLKVYSIGFNDLEQDKYVRWIRKVARMIKH